MPLLDDARSTHPRYDQYVPDWKVLRDVFQGERVIKAAKQTYLPATSGQILDGMGSAEALGSKQYAAYVARAVFPDLFAPTISALCGVMHRNPSELELPPSLKTLELSATPKREGISALQRKVSCELLVTGRHGVLVDPATGNVNTPPRLVSYETEAIRNWDEIDLPDGTKALSFLVLDESRWERHGMTWEWVEKYRVMELVEGVYQTWTVENRDGGEHTTDPVVPMIGGRSLDRIPFVFANPADLDTDPDRPPLIGLANLSLAIYRGEADYRQNLFMQAQDTPVVIGSLMQPAGDEKESAPVRFGAGSMLNISEGGDAKYIGVSATGLSEQRQALENDYSRAAEMGSKLLRSSGGTAESGEALRIRMAAQTATIATIAMASAGAIESALKIAAGWSNADPDGVMLKPNLDFSEDDMANAARALRDVVLAKAQGAPISNESIHRLMRETDLTLETFEDEIAKLAAEGAASASGGEPEPGDPAAT